MRFTLRIFVLLALVVAAQGHAHAENPVESPSSWYVYEGLTASKIRGELSARALNVLQVQVGLGYQPKNSLWAYELMGRVGGTLDFADPSTSVVGWGVRAKRFIPLRPHFNLYGRAGVTENFLSSAEGPDLAGFGLEYGVGAMASMRVRALGFLFWPAFFTGIGPKVNASLWVDLGGKVGNMHVGHESSSESYGYRSVTASYGLKIGGNF